MKSPLELNHVWPESYSVNSAQKVWGAAFAAHHPNVIVFDLSWFKCGHDAPVYGLIDSILQDTAKYGLGGGGAMAVFQKMAIGHAGDFAVRTLLPELRARGGPLRLQSATAPAEAAAKLRPGRRVVEMRVGRQICARSPSVEPRRRAAALP